MSSQEQLEHEEFEIEYIVDHRWIHGHLEYLIKWKGLLDSENTWQEEDKITNRDAVASYIIKRTQITNAQAVQTANENSDDEAEEQPKQFVLPLVHAQQQPQQQPVHMFKSPQANNDLINIAFMMQNGQPVCVGTTAAGITSIIDVNFARFYYPTLYQRAVNAFVSGSNTLRTTSK